MDSYKPIDFRSLNEAAITQCPGLLERLLPEGKLVGHEFTCGNLSGESGKSCKINIDNGKWSDFSTGESGGDIISLVAAIKNINQYQAAKILAEMIGYSLPGTFSRKKENKENYAPIIPVPDEKADIRPDFKHFRHGNPTEIYTYRDENRKLIGYTCRFNKQGINSKGKQEKEFSPLIYTNNGWRWQGFTIPYPFYGLEKLSNLPATGLVIVVEGEGKANKLQAVMGSAIAVLAIHGGSSKTKNMNYRPLHSKTILYWPDKDKPGYKAALEFAKKAQPLAESLKIIMPPEEAKETWDCADAIEEGWNSNNITEWIEKNRFDPEEFAKLVNLEFTEKNNKPVIRYLPGELPRLVKELEKSIQGRAWQRNGLLVKVINLPEKKSYHGLKMKEGTSLIVPFDIDDLKLLANKCANWIRIKTTKDITREIPIDPPQSVIQAFLADKGYWELPTLSGLVTCPIIRPDGSILDKPGYDETTGLYADFDANAFTLTKENPTREEAEEALAILKDAISEFPFKTSIDQSVALAGLLTTVIRPSVAHSPLFAFSAPTPGTGKSTLADLIGIMATGKPCAAMDYNRDEAEFKKSIFATLLEGPSVVLIDNAIGEVNSSLLNMVLTQECIKGRILGASQNANLPTNSLWLATGNNLTIVGDLTRRTLFCTLDAGVEAPAKRKFKRDIYKWAEENRSNLINAAITVLRAFFIAGKPTQNMEPMNGFNDWSNWIRGTLLWLGEKDPRESQNEIEARDPERESLRTILHAWHEHFGSEFVTTKELLSREAIDGGEISDSQITLYQALLDAIPHGRELNGRILGKWLANNAGRVIDGLRLLNTKQKGHDNSIYWKIEKS